MYIGLRVPHGQTTAFRRTVICTLKFVETNKDSYDVRSF